MAKKKEAAAPSLVLAEAGIANDPGSEVPDPGTEPVRIVELRSENTMGIRAIAIRPKPRGITEIAGANASGKSSVLNTVVRVLQGGRSLPEQYLRIGAEKGKDTIVLSNGYTAERRVTRKGNYLEVTKADGSEMPSPAAWCASLVSGELAFNPVAFSLMEPKKQAETLIRAAGKTGELEEFRAARIEWSEKRRDAERDLKNTRAVFASMPVVEAAETETSAAALSKELEDAIAENAENETRREWLKKAKKTAEAWEKKTTEINAAIAELQRKLEADQRSRDASYSVIELHKAGIESLADADLTPIRLRIAEVDQINAAVRAKKARAETHASLQFQEKEHARLDRAVQDTDEEIRELLATVKLPIKGLTVTEDGAFLDRVPLAQVNTSAKIALGIEVHIAQKNQLRTAIVEGGSLLDEQALDALAILAEKHDMQILIESVGKGHAGAIVISDGMIEEGTP